MFRLTVSGIFTICGSATVTGRVAQGQVALGDALVLHKRDGTRLTTEALILNTGDQPAGEGEQVGISLKDISAEQVSEGDQLVGADQAA